MIVPSQAIMRPRAACPETGESLPLEELVESFCDRHDAGAIELVGDAGSGKSTALAHLAEVLCTGKAVLYLDDARPEDVASAKALRLIVYTTARSWPKIADMSFQLSPWGDDDLIEFLLAVRPDRCKSVVARVRAATDRNSLRGNPELWRIVLERMAADETVGGPREILQAELSGCLSALPNDKLIYDYALARMRGMEGLSSEQRVRLTTLGANDRLLRLLHHRVVHVMLATTRLRDSLKRGQFEYRLFRRLPYELIRETALAVRDSTEAMNGLFEMLAGPRLNLQSIAASILHATGTGWIPVEQAPPPSLLQRAVAATRKVVAKLGGLPRLLPCLESAHLAGAKWPGVKLAGIRINEANLSGADLSGATFANAHAVGCRLPRASLRKADLTWINLRHADLREADFSGASLKRADLRETNLTSACFRATQLCGANLTGATIDGADFSGADFTVATLDNLPLKKSATLNGAEFNSASLVRCDLEGVRARRGQFSHANLSHALLTGSVMPRANFQGARLDGAGLADIEWERADLRHANLRGCSFFLGSSRSGLVGSPLASEGTRTGFYTDDFDEQTFKSPEEIRKANLRGADIRGAKIEGVDFYLVDLRNAKYTRKQAEQLLRCGAILSKRRTR